MVFRCDDCGNTEYFRAWDRATHWVDEKVLITGQGDIEDCIDTEITNSENLYEFQDVCCASCGSYNVNDYCEDELDELDLPKRNRETLRNIVNEVNEK